MDNIRWIYPDKSGWILSRWLNPCQPWTEPKILLLFSNRLTISSGIMDTIGKIAASVAPRPEKQETKMKTEAGDQGGWGLDFR